MLTRIWIKADGTAIPINQMEESHIFACIRKIQRSRKWRKEWLEPLQLELEIRALVRKNT